VHVFTTHLCSTHFLPADRAPQIIADAIEARQSQVKDIADFIKVVLESTFDYTTDCALLTGDLNIWKYPPPSNFIDSKLGLNENFEEAMKKLNGEYEECLIRHLVNGVLKGRFNVEDLTNLIKTPKDK
jgi:hypothetical protein